MMNDIVALIAFCGMVLVALLVVCGISVKLGRCSERNAACEYIANNDVRAMRACQDKPPWKR